MADNGQMELLEELAADRTELKSALRELLDQLSRRNRKIFWLLDKLEILEREAAEKDRALNEAGERLADKEREVRATREGLEGRLAGLEAQLAEKERALEEMGARLAEKEREAEAVAAELEQVTNSVLWRAFCLIRYPGAPISIAARKLCASASLAAVAFALLHHGAGLAFVRKLWEYRYIRRSGLFDGEYYLRANEDVARARLDPLLHYVLHGAGEGRDPNALFRTAYYLRQLPDGSSAAGNALIHYVQEGSRAGLNPSPWFDAAFYIESNPDVAEAGLDPLYHYIHFGSKEGRLPASREPDAHLKMQRRICFPPGHTTAVASSPPLISVVMLVYDRTEMLRESIQSVLRQTYQDFELLLVCDGSPPETMSVVNEYRMHPKVRVFSYKDNSGSPVRGRNRGIREARGAFVAFQDSDDIAEPTRLEASYLYAQQYGADVVYGNWRARIEPGAEGYGDIVDGEIVHSPDCDYSSLKERNHICQSTVMARTKALREIGALKPEMHYCEDYELWLRLAYRGYVFKSVPEVLATLRLHSGNLESRHRKDTDLYIQRALEEHKSIPRLKPSVAFVIPGRGISGGIMVICQHANRLVAKGYDVILIDSEPDKPFDLGWFPTVLPEIIPFDKVDSKVDIAVATHWSTAYVVKDWPSERKIYFVQSDETRFAPAGSHDAELAGATYGFDFEFVTVAKWLQRWLRESFGKSAVYVPNAVDRSIFYPDEPLAPRGDKVRVLLEGPIDIPFKGMEDAFRAAEGLDCEVWCVSSSGRPKSTWKCDRFFEKVPHDTMRKVYSSCDVLLKMSRVEGFFMPPLEMMACGGTVITTRVTGFEEYIVDGYNALTVDVGDVPSAREKLALLIDDREALTRLKRGGLKTAAQWPSWDSSNDKLEEVLLRGGA